MSYIHFQDVCEGGPDNKCLPITIPSQYSKQISDKTALLVLYVVATAADDYHNSWLSLMTIANRTGLAERTVRIALKAIVENGYLEKVGLAVPRKRGDTYRITTPGFRQLESQIEDSKEHQGKSKKNPKSVRTHSHGDSNMQSRGDSRGDSRRLAYDNKERELKEEKETFEGGFYGMLEAMKTLQTEINKLKSADDFE